MKLRNRRLTALAAVAYGLLLAPLALLVGVRDPASRSVPIRTVPKQVGAP